MLYAWTLWEENLCAEGISAVLKELHGGELLNVLF